MDPTAQELQTDKGHRRNAWIWGALLLSGLAVKLARDYDAQRATGKLPTFDARKYPEIRSKLAPGIWD